MDKSRQQHRQQQQQQHHSTGVEASLPATALNTVEMDADYAELHVVFEFFTDNPQKTMPADANSPHKDSPYYDPYWDAIRSMQSNQQFLEGILLRCVDCNPRYPFIHYIVYKNNAVSTSLTTTTTTTTTTPPTTTTKTSQPAVNGTSRTPRDLHRNGRLRNHVHKQIVDITKSHGSYRELHTFIGRQMSLLPKRPSNPNTAYIVSAFMTSGNLDSLDKTWSYWSGADYIVENIPTSLKLERVTFHKVAAAAAAAAAAAGSSVTTALDGSGTAAAAAGGAGAGAAGCFSYVLLCELGEAMADLNRAREFIDHLKFRQCGISSLYVIDHFF